MDRPIVYAGALPQDTDLLNIAKNAMISDGYIATSVLGGNTLIDNLPVQPTSPASMTVQVGPGSISVYTTVDSTAYGSLPADAGTLRKTGINDTFVPLALAGPSTSGQTIVYLIQVTYGEVDTGNTLLSYYNAANPQQPLFGPNNSGVTQATVRKQIVQIQAKAGIPGASAVAPAVDAGWYAIATVTIAYGQQTITAANISPVSIPQRMSMNLFLAANQLSTAITSSGQTLNPNDPNQIWQAMENAASIAGAKATLGFTPVTQGSADGITLTWDRTTGFIDMVVNGTSQSAIASQSFVSAFYQPKIGYKTVKQGGNQANPQTNLVSLDFNNATQLPNFQADGVNNGQGVNTDLATPYWVQNHYQPALGFIPVTQASTHTISLAWDPNASNLSANIDGAYLGTLAIRSYTDATYQPILTYKPVAQGGNLGNPQTTRAYMDFNNTSKLPYFQADGVNNGQGFISDLATTTWTTNNFARLSQFAWTINTTNGYQVLPSGIIIQWGTGLSVTGYQDTVTYNLSFPSGTLSVTAIEGNAVGWGAQSGGTYSSPTIHGISNAGKSNFQLSSVGWRTPNWQYLNGISFSYIAIGY